jgi:hypothetical protein
MLALLSDCITVEQYGVIQFLLSEGVKPSVIHRRMLAQYREDCIMQMDLYQYVEGSIVSDQLSLMKAMWAI